jgi:hypothetical protein
MENNDAVLASLPEHGSTKERRGPVWSSPRDAEAQPTHLH